MATILIFPERREAAESISAPREGSAQILFFTGVRYERTEPKRKRKAVAAEPELPLAL